MYSTSLRFIFVSRYAWRSWAIHSYRQVVKRPVNPSHDKPIHKMNIEFIDIPFFITVT